MSVRQLTVTLSLTAVVAILIGVSSCGKPEEEEDDAGGGDTPTAVTAAFTETCTTCHDADGIGGSIADESDLVAYTKNNSFETFLDLIRNNPPADMTASPASLYSDEAAASDYAYFKAK